MGETIKQNFSTRSDWDRTGLTLVYDGPVDVSVGWNTITLDNSFLYNNASNLLICIDSDEAGDGAGGSSASKGFFTEAGHTGGLLPGTGMALRQHSDSEDNDYGNVNYDGTIDDNLPSLKLTFDCVYPTVQASSLSMSNWALNSYTLNWTRGNGDNVMVVAKASSAPSDPTSGTSYTANAAYGSGDACGGGFVVYNGTGTSVNLTNLTDGTDYYFAVYEYNNTGVLQYVSAHR